MAEETNLCVEFGCAIGCIANYHGQDIYVVREDGGRVGGLLKGENMFLFCPDCGSDVRGVRISEFSRSRFLEADQTEEASAGVMIARPQDQLEELAKQLKEIKFAPDC